MQETPIQFLGIPCRRDRLPTPVFMGFPGSSEGKESTCNAGDLSSIPGLRRSPGGGHSNPLQYTCLGNPHGQWSLGSQKDTTEGLSTSCLIFVNRIFLKLYLLRYNLQGVKLNGAGAVCYMRHARIKIPDQGWSLRLLQWKGGVLTTRLPGKPSDSTFECIFL